MANDQGVNMLKAIALGAALAIMATTICEAAEGCGDLQWRDAYGHLWFHNEYGTDRGTTHACPTRAFWVDGRCVPM
jgi:hypothetical protein